MNKRYVKTLAVCLLMLALILTELFLVWETIKYLWGALGVDQWDIPLRVSFFAFGLAGILGVLYCALPIFGLKCLPRLQKWIAS